MTAYRISEFADLGGVSAKTLRFYDEIGLLRPATVDPRTRYRQYLPHQLGDLASIRALKDMGASLGEVRDLMAISESRKGRRELLQDLKQKIEESIRTGKQSLNWINAALDELDDSVRPISVVVKRRPAVPIASVRAEVRTYGDIAQYENKLLSALPPQSVGTQRGVLWHRCADSGSLEGEPFVGLKQRVPASSSYDLKLLPEVTVACAYSAPDDKSSEAAYHAIRRWMHMRGYSLAGAKREIYLDHVLEIQFPVKSA